MLTLNVLINEHFIATMVRTSRKATVVTGAVKQSLEDVAPDVESLFTAERTGTGAECHPLWQCDDGLGFLSWGHLFPP